MISSNTYVVNTSCEGALFHKGIAKLDTDFNILRDSMSRNFWENGERELFTVDTTNLFDIWLNNMPMSERPYHNCRCCRRFMEKYGGAVQICSEGRSEGTLFGMHLLNVPQKYRQSIDALQTEINRRQVIGVLKEPGIVWGVTSRDGWNHFWLRSSPMNTWSGEFDESPEQYRALKLEDYRTLSQNLYAFSRGVVGTAIDMLKSGSLWRAEKVLLMAEWLDALQENNKLSRPRQSCNLLHLAAATAPPGFCNFKSGMLGSLLSDIQDGISTQEEVIRRFNTKMDPLKYQRAQVAPAAGNVEAAARLVERLGVEKAFARRHASIPDVAKHAIWFPEFKKVSAHIGDSIFSAVKPKEVQPLSVSHGSSVKISFNKFRRDILPRAKEMFVILGDRASFTGFTTQYYEDAPPILQWDRIDNRNPVAWYCRADLAGNSTPMWGLRVGVLIKVSMLTEMPNQWHSVTNNHGRGAVFLLDGCRDINDVSSALFPEFMKSELHPIRSTIEAYSNANKMKPVPRMSVEASGVSVREGSMPLHVRVNTSNTSNTYLIDRFE